MPFGKQYFYLRKKEHIMKKFLALVLALVMALSLVACGEKVPADDAGAADGAKVVKIGVFEPQTGDNGAGGKQEILGMQYANYVQPTVEIGGVQKQMKAFVGSKAVAVNPHADELELATAFAAHLATPDAQKLRYECNSTIPAAASLINDPVISHDPVAKAEISNITNASNVQPIIPEMSNYWAPVESFGGKIASGEINEANYMMYVDQLLAELNGGIIDDNTVTLSVWAPDQDLTDGGWMEVMQKAFAADHPELNIVQKSRFGL